MESSQIFQRKGDLIECNKLLSVTEKVFARTELDMAGFNRFIHGLGRVGSIAQNIFKICIL